MSSLAQWDPNLTVLVVDDHALQRKVVIKRLHALGVGNVVEAEDGAETCAKVEAMQIDLILCDLDMPDVDGLGVLRYLVERKSPIGISIFSAHDPVILECIELLTENQPVRFLGVIEKPVTDQRLVEILTAFTEAPPARQAAASLLPLESIRDGLAAGEFVPYFQPIVSATTGRVRSVEALARWNHPVEGVLSPATFLATMEEQDGANALTWQILKGSLSFIRETSLAGYSLPVSINLSAGFLARRGVAETISKMLAEASIRADQVSFEVTETTALTTSIECLENLARLRMRGHSLAVDDFGTAYASLKQLVRVPFRTMKFDRSFLHDAMGHPRAWKVMVSSLAMARALDMESVIEGVENAEERARILSLDADFHQGYLYAKPMSLEVFIPWLKEGKRIRL